MTRQNRVTPLGELIADPARGLVYGNRGCLHHGSGRVLRAYNGKRWISCRLEFRGRRRAALMQPGRYTELFFLDEATALAAGHRPCAECRREDYNLFCDLWGGGARADTIDVQLHEERLGPREAVDVETLPDGAFVLAEETPHVVVADRLLRWTPAGYAAPKPRCGSALLVTPPSLVTILRAGWNGSVPFLHPSARGLQS